METKEAVKYMKTLFHDYWTKELKYKAGYDNLASKAPDENDPYAEFRIFHVTADRSAFMGTAAKERYRQDGRIVISLYVPSNTGVESAYEYTQGIMNVFRRPPADCQIFFTDFTFAEDPERYRDFFRIVIQIRFQYDYFH